MRETLTPPPLDTGEVRRLTALANAIVDSIDAGGDPTEQIATFNHQTAQEFTATHFLAAAGSMDMGDFVQIALVPPAATRKQLVREELLELIEVLLTGEGSDYETNYWLALLESNVPHPRVSDLIYWPRREMNAEEILIEALAYQPIITPPPAAE